MRVLILLFLVLALPAEAQVARCVSATGRVEYRDPPCPANTKGAWVGTRMQSETSGGESAADIERRAAAIREAQYRADQARIDARAAAAGTGTQQQPSSGLSPYTPPSTSGSAYTPPAYRGR